MVTLKLRTREFAFIKVTIDISSFIFDSTIEGYDYDDLKSFNTISFILADESKTDDIVNEIKKTFQLKLEKPEDINKYIRVKDSFQDWESDKRKRVIINFKSGLQGFRNPASFGFE